MSKPSKSRSSKKKVELGGGTATRKLEPVKDVCIVNLDDDDDDDFKPSKANPFRPKGMGRGGHDGHDHGRGREPEVGRQKPIVEQLKITETEESLGDGDDLLDLEDHYEKAIPDIPEEEEVAEVEFHLEEMLLNSGTGTPQQVEEDKASEDPFFEEDEDEVTILLSTGNDQATPPKPKGNSAWKNLMEQMQKNQQKDAGARAATAGTSKKNKAPVKRGLALSPQSKGVKSKSKTARSPLKKTPRLGFGLGVTTLPDTKQMTANESSSKTKENGLKGTEDDLSERKALTEMEPNVPSSSTNLDLSSKKPAKVAPIFLPPEERKALQQASKIAKIQSTDNIDSLLDSFAESSSHFTENPEHFSGNVVILNDEEITKDPYGGTKTKVCPFYKKLPGVPFCVDAFNYGLIPGMEVYFLSHFHSDHYIGLTKKFCKTIICDHPTGNLVHMKLYVEDKYIRKLCLNKPYIICDAEVTLIEANHCPGSVMFIFRLKNGQVILHTGDFRYTKEMFDNPSLSGLRVDSLYLDTTYCSPEYDFPTQRESVSNVIIQVKRRLEYRPKTLILCGSYLIGKERVYFTLAEAIGSKVFANSDKRRVLHALENPKFSGLLTADENASNLHVVSMMSLGAKNLQEYLAKYPQYTNIIGIRPSGWQFSSASSGCSVKSHYGDSVTIMGVPYSEHSSFSELKEFVTRLRPKHVQPTVNVGNVKKRGDMMGHIESWLSS